eukprot:scaffold7230_cov44-Prasinocladus_malaysianus.AAC.1
MTQPQDIRHTLRIDRTLQASHNNDELVSAMRIKPQGIDKLASELSLVDHLTLQAMLSPTFHLWHTDVRRLEEGNLHPEGIGSPGRLSPELDMHVGAQPEEQSRIAAN